MKKKILKFRKVLKSDLPLIKKWRNNSEIQKNNSQYLLLDMMNQNTWFKTINKKTSTRKMFIVTNEKNQPFAICGLINIDKSFHTGEIAIIIGDVKLHGKGYGTEILSYLIRYGFSKLNLHRIEAKIFEYNSISIKLFKKLHFQFEAKLEDSLWRKNQWWSIFVFSILKNDFE